MRRDIWEIVIVRHGTRETTRSEVFLNYDWYGEPDAPFTVDYFLWVLRNGQDSIVVDTGFASGPARRRGRSVLIDPVDALHRLGVDPASGVPVVITHAHYDHIGNLGAFTGSPVHIAAAELEFWTSEVAQRPLFRHFSEPEEIDALQRARTEGRLRPFTGQANIAPGVRAVEVGGHTPGQAVVVVDTVEGTVVLASDAAHFVEELERDMPFISMADLPQSYRALEQLRQDDAAHIITGHDAGTLDRYPPLGDPLPGLAAVIGRRP